MSISTEKKEKKKYGSLFLQAFIEQRSKLMKTSLGDSMKVYDAKVLRKPNFYLLGQVGTLCLLKEIVS